MTEGKPTGHDARILVIDDDPLLLRATSRLLTGAGYDVVEAATGREGLQLSKKTRPDLVLLDVMLPDSDGLQVCRRIKADAALANTFVALLSGEGVDSDNPAEGLEESADDYVVRPVSNRELLARVEAMLRLQRAEDMRRAQMHELKERLKELNCLYGISKLIESEDLSLPEILQGTAELIPPAWQFPDIACARIFLDDEVYQTEGFQETTWRQSRAIQVHRKPAGMIEVYYWEERPEEHEGPFLEEERSLLNAIAERLGRIVERIRAETALSESEERYRAVSELTSDLAYAFRVEADGSLVSEWVTQSLSQVTGFTLEELAARGGWTSLIHPDDWSAAQRHTQRLLSGEDDACEIRIITKEGQVRWLHDSGHPQWDEAQRRVARIYGAAREITERRQMENALQRERDLLARVMDTSPVGIAVFDQEGRLTFANALLQQLASLTGAITIIGRTYNDPAWQLLTTEGDPLPDEALPFARVMSTGGPVHEVEHNTVLPDGQPLWLSSNAAPLFDASGQIESVVVTTEDITARKLAEAKLEEAAATAERERLARDLHDAVTQSLFSVAAIAEAMPRVWERDPEEAKRGLEDLRWLTQGALAEMRAMLLELRPAALMEQKLGVLLRQLTDAMRSRTRMPVTMTVVGECDLTADVQIALYRIAQEALNNITKHARPSQAKVSLHNELGLVRLRISDDGIGFDPETASAHHLGLEIMRERAEAIGATLRIESQPNHGTRIEVEWRGN